MLVSNTWRYSKHYIIRERATGIMQGASHASEYSEAYSGGFDDLLLSSDDDDASPSCCDRVMY
jgi:hypothetical protein